MSATTTSPSAGAKVDAEDLQRYVVYRSTEDAGLAPIATTNDSGLPGHERRDRRGNTEYAVTAQDLAFNESPPTPSLAVDAAERIVQVVFRVTVPASTPTTDSLFIAGDFQGWAPGQTPMTKVDASTWSITLPVRGWDVIEYKYTRRTGGRGEGRWLWRDRQPTMTADFGESEEQVIDDVVAKWRDVDGCG